MTNNFAETLMDLAAADPFFIAYTFLSADREETNISAGQLHLDAILIAEMLCNKGIRPGDRVLLVFDHGYEVVAAFWGALYAGVLPTICPYFSERKEPAVYLDRFRQAADSEKIRLIVAPAKFSGSIHPEFQSDGCPVICLPTMPLNVFSGVVKKHFLPGQREGLAYIQFSSGTTGRPKGIMISHDALIHYMEITKEALGCTSDDVTVGWLPLHHDMGLITQVLHPLYCRQRSILLNPSDWLAMPHALFRSVDRYRGSISWMPNFAFNYCTRRIFDEDLEGLDLSSWRILGCGSEPVQVEALEAFKKRFSSWGLCPHALKIAYGLAEHVAGVTITPLDRFPDVDWVGKKDLSGLKAVPAEPNSPDSAPIMSCGCPKPTVLIRIADETENTKGDREIGEVLLNSPSLFSGYHLSPEQTARALKNGWLHTGDMGYLVDGQLYITGRKKDLIIVGGNNIAPDYIESIGKSILGKICRYSAAFGFHDAALGTERLVLVCEMRETPDDDAASQFTQAIRDQVKNTLGVFVADICLVAPGWIIKTTSGKISRSDTREKYLSVRKQGHHDVAISVGAGEASFSVETIQQGLIRIWEKLFGIFPLTLEDNFFELGGDSLLAIQMVLEIESVFHCSLPVAKLFESPTISELAKIIIKGGQSAGGDLLVAIQPKASFSTRPIFFCVHGIAGGILNYRPLAVALGREQPFYGIQAKGLSSNFTIAENVEEMAANYIRAVRSIQPKGPFYLGGHCFGGVIAFEMSRQLVDAGEEIGLLAVFEGYPPSYQAGRSRVLNEWVFAFNFIRNLPFWIREYFQLGRLARRYRSQRIVGVFRKRCLRLIGFSRDMDIRDIVDNAQSLTERYQNVTENNIHAMRGYRIEPFNGRMVLFRTSHRVPGRPEISDRGWGKLAAGVDVCMVPGGHTTMLKEPHVRILAGRLEVYLSNANARPLNNGIDS